MTGSGGGFGVTPVKKTKKINTIENYSGGGYKSVTKELVFPLKPM